MIIIRFIFLLLLVLTGPYLQAQRASQILYDKGIVNDNCGSVGDAYVESTCIAGIHRIVARSVTMEALADLNAKRLCYGMDNYPPASTPVNCDPPYDRCESRYCPDKYALNIKLLVDLKASLISRAAANWGRAEDMQDGYALDDAFRQLIIDINKAYDCAGLRRPIIQGTIFENCDAGVQKVKIPAYVVKAFESDPAYMSNKSYYDTLPKFTYTNIITNHDCPDITKLEARMWFYYLATRYIDMGYKSIHMGQAHIWGDPPNFTHTNGIIKKIRDYAKSHNTFVLLTNESYNCFKVPGNDTLLFDFDTRATRPREISNPQVCGDFGCNGNVNTGYFSNTACSSETYPAFIDKCVIANAGRGSGTTLTGGIHPLTKCIITKMPYNTYLDHGDGFDTTKVQGVPTDYCKGDQGVYGYDDTKWFKQFISTPFCRSYWLTSHLDRIRGFHEEAGYMGIPGIIPVKMPENRHNANPGHVSDALYMIVDEYFVNRDIKDKLTVSENASVFIENISSYPSNRTCGGRGTAYQKQYYFNVQNADYTTIYTYHIKRPDGVWEPFTYGKTRSYEPPISGYYDITLRQDNLGLSNIYGAKVNTFRTYLERDNCANVRLSTDEAILIEVSNKDFYDHMINDFGATDVPYAEMEKDNSSASISIFPNPSSSDWILSFNVSCSMYEAIELCDMQGRIVWSKSLGNNSEQNITIPNEELNKGVYFINIKGQKFSKKLKAVKQ